MYSPIACASVAGVERLLALRLRLLAGQRHPAGGDLELDRRGSDADQARPLVLNSLRVAAMAGDAAGVEDRLALVDVGLRRRRVLCGGLHPGGESRVEAADDQQGQAHPHRAGDASPQRAARAGWPSRLPTRSGTGLPARHGNGLAGRLGGRGFAHGTRAGRPARHLPAAGAAQREPHPPQRSCHGLTLVGRYRGSVKFASFHWSR